MKFSKLIDDYFTSSFNEDVVVYYKQGGETTAGDFGPMYVNALTDTVTTQPDDFFVMYRKSGLTTNNTAIGLRSDVRKRQEVRITFNLYTAAIGSPARESDIEEALDNLFLNIQLKDTNEFLYSNQDTPKVSARMDSTGANVWHDKQITYRFFYEWI